MKRFVAFVVLVTFAAPQLLLAKVDSDKAAYFGGTVIGFVGAKEPVEGDVNTTDPDALVFTGVKKPYAGQEMRIPYKQIQDLEYGQKAGRRVGATIGYSLHLGPLGLLTLFSKKRNHYLTISWMDEAQKEHVAVLELGRDIVRSTLPVVKTRSGKDITFQDEDAKKAAGGGS